MKDRTDMTGELFVPRRVLTYTIVNEQHVRMAPAQRSLGTSTLCFFNSYYVMLQFLSYLTLCLTVCTNNALPLIVYCAKKKVHINMKRNVMYKEGSTYPNTINSSLQNSLTLGFLHS